MRIYSDAHNTILLVIEVTILWNIPITLIVRTVLTRDIEAEMIVQIEGEIRCRES